MKFIKTLDGEWLNVAQVNHFDIESEAENSYTVFARSGEWDYALIEFFCDPKSTTQFDPKEAAQAWLDDFIAKLNLEEMKWKAY